jgi:hypothetical protein
MGAAANIIGADEAIAAFADQFTIKILQNDILHYAIAQGQNIAADSCEWFNLKPGDALIRMPACIIATLN